MNEILQALIGPVSLVVAAIAWGLYVVSVLLRERTGKKAVVRTLATGRPLLTGCIAFLLFAAGALVILRLGVLS